MQRKVQVHILPTGKKISYGLNTGDLAYSPFYKSLTILTKAQNLAHGDWVGQHLYFTTDEKIKIGDWYILYLEKTGWQVRQLVKDMKTSDSIKTHLTDWVIVSGSRKIVATTNPKLLDYSYTCDKCDGLGGRRCDCERGSIIRKGLPKIDDSFVKKYVESKGTITEYCI